MIKVVAIPSASLELEMEVGGLELWYWTCYGVIDSPWRICPTWLSWVEQATQTAEQRSLYLESERKLTMQSDRSCLFYHIISYHIKFTHNTTLYLHVKTTALRNARMYTVQGWISKDGRAANLTSAPGGLRSRWLRHCRCRA